MARRGIMMCQTLRYGNYKFFVEMKETLYVFSIRSNWSIAGQFNIG